ncbi:MAG: flavodoxin family protein [Fervidicoccus fontis]|nr:MAG: flavodoxin family protein [Fervidicoccus fontis]
MKNMSAKILFIDASARKGGNSTKLMYVAELGARKRGCETEIIYLKDHKIKPCAGCVSDDIMACKFPCVIDDDDFNSLARKLIESDGVVIATPVYWYMVSGIMKNFIDRLTSLENMLFHTGKSLVDGKVAAFIATGSDTGTSMTIAYLMDVFNSFGYHIPPWSLAYHHSIDDSLDNGFAVYDSYNLGINVCRAAEIMKKEKEPWYSFEYDLNEIKNYAKRMAERDGKNDSLEKRIEKAKGDEC